MGNIKAWRMNRDEWLHPDMFINYGGEYLQLVYSPKSSEFIAWSCCVCGKRLQDVSSLSHVCGNEPLQFTPHILVKYYPPTPSNRKLERRYCLECRRIPKIEIQEAEEGMPGTEEEVEQTETAERVLETPESLVLKGICILPVFCIHCGASLPAEGKKAKVFFCSRCKDALQPDEGLIDVALYCTVCGQQKALNLVEYLRKITNGGTVFTLCWDHAFSYQREYYRGREAKRQALHQSLDICMAQGYSSEDCKILRDAIDEC